MNMRHWEWFPHEWTGSCRPSKIEFEFRKWEQDRRIPGQDNNEV